VAARGFPGVTTHTWASVAEGTLSTVYRAPMSRARVAVLVLLSALSSTSAVSAARDANLAAALATVRATCPAPSRAIATDEWVAGWRFNALYGNCLAGDGRDQHIWFFVGRTLVGSDTREPDSSKQIVGLWRDGDTIAFMYVLYRRSDSNCCPTGGGKIVRFHVSGTHVRALDRFPPHQLGGVALGR
jgi:LppP/LprE lipoprotein